MNNKSRENLLDYYDLIKICSKCEKKFGAMENKDGRKTKKTEVCPICIEALKRRRKIAKIKRNHSFSKRIWR